MSIELDKLKNILMTMIKKRTVLITLMVLSLSLVAVIAFRTFMVTDIDPESEKQVDFIRDFIDNIDESNSGRWLALDKLYDKNIVKDIIYFPWNYSNNLKLKKAIKVEKDDGQQVSNCKDYLFKTYKVNDVEAYRVVIRQSYSDDAGGILVEDIDDIAYLTKKGERYFLLYTQSLFEELNSTKSN